MLVDQAKTVVEFTIQKWKLQKQFAVTPYKSSENTHTFIVTFSLPTNVRRIFFFYFIFVLLQWNLNNYFLTC